MRVYIISKTIINLGYPRRYKLVITPTGKERKSYQIAKITDIKAVSHYSNFRRPDFRLSAA